MILLPAIDIIGGRAVRLIRGDYEKVSDYGDPVEAAMRIKAAGATHLHVVDLDGAKDGTLANLAIIERIVGASGLTVEVGGGIRDLNRIERYLCAGADRVILGTAAVKDPSFAGEAVRAFGAAHVSAGVDAKDGLVAVDGWKSVTAHGAEAFVRRLMDEGITNVIYTDIARDGMLQGTNLALYERLCKVKGLLVTASGGVTTTDELIALKGYGVYAAIVGKAMYEGRLDLAAALQAVNG